MKDVMTVTLTTPIEKPMLFAFAYDDYCEKYNKTTEEVNGMRSCGVVLEYDDSIESIINFTDIAITAGMFDLIVFDINRLNTKQVEDIAVLPIWNENGYEELKYVYEDRIVFAKKPE